MKSNTTKGKLFAIIIIAIGISGCVSKNNFRTITVEKYTSKMKAGWLGQMAGVGWAAPTEFKNNTSIISENEVPKWETHCINQQFQDDIYVEMTFLKTLETYGFDVSIRQAGIDFANSKYMLWHANLFGRNNLQAGIAPPYSGYPKYNAHADDIDYQIEADFSGLISPGLPQSVIDLGNKFGRIMNYGDGVYGGQFVGAMYAEAFFEKDVSKIVQAGLVCIPKESQYAEMVNDVIKWYNENPKDWQKTWQLVENKYNLNKEYRKFSCNGADAGFNIDAKMNGAYVVMGLLYGEGDMDKTIIISMRCGKDSDCNPSNAAGILATSFGLENLPEQYKTNIDVTTKFSFTDYNLPKVLEVCEELAKKNIIKAGGRIEKNETGEDVLFIPVQAPKIDAVEQSWNVKDIKENIYFTKEEKAKIIVKVRTADDMITAWNVAGPFTKKDVNPMELFNVAFEPETNDEYSKWKNMPIGKDGYESDIINLGKFYNVENSVAYLKTKIWIDNVQDVLFEMGSDDGIKVWLNNQIIHQNNLYRGHSQGEDIAQTKLIKGWNTIMMKITQGAMGWATSLVITDLKGNVLTNIKYE